LSVSYLTDLVQTRKWKLHVRKLLIIYSTIGYYVVALTACSFIPEYFRPQSPVAYEYPKLDDSTKAASTDSSADIQWQQIYTDKRLQRLITLALDKNRDLRIAALNIESARAQYRIQEAALFPTVNATTEATRAKTINTLGGGGVLPSYSIYSVGLGFTAYEIDFFGRLRSLKQQALQQFIATKEARTSAQISLIAEVANAYINARALDERLDVALQTQKSQQSSYALASKIFEFGNSSALDLRIAETQMETANANVAALKRLRAQADNGLALLVGSPVPADLPLPQALNNQLMVSELQAGLPSELLTRRPDIHQAESLLKAANANIGAARAAFFPSIKLTSSIGRASSEFDRLFTSGSSVWNFAPQLSLPIFDAGNNKANLKLAEVQKDINIARYEKVIQTAFREVADAMAANTMLIDEIEAQQRLVNAEQVRFKLAELRYQNGVDSNLSVLDAQRSLYTAQQSLIELRQSKLTALVTLYKALGGGAS
jgi:multidrug efflux system outer membrane protein